MIRWVLGYVTVFVGILVELWLALVVISDFWLTLAFVAQLLVVALVLMRQTSPGHPRNRRRRRRGSSLSN